MVGGWWYFVFDDDWDHLRIYGGVDACVIRVECKFVYVFQF